MKNLLPKRRKIVSATGVVLRKNQPQERTTTKSFRSLTRQPRGV